VARGDNAHIRKTKRADSGVKAEQALRLLDDPAFQDAVEKVRREFTDALSDVNPEEFNMERDAAFERELCRSLRTLNRVVRAVCLAYNGQKLRLAEFRPNRAGNED